MKRDRHGFNRKRQSRRPQTSFDRWVEQKCQDDAFREMLETEMLQCRQNWDEWMYYSKTLH